ncbi:Ig-like domain-containing protein [Parapedobacter tibetensis]|uniref:Ig-like domain-containing protein n=1 Tax=Parapedobacter tibetensis TaxID=2972951 RepID=UPI00214D6996|nr:Ig-like domain-containing protein [Parapedobacter tibetensis]
MKTSTIKQTALTLVLGLVFLFSSCKKDNPEMNLTLDRTTIEVFADEQATVQITSGNNNYSVSSSSEATAMATVSEQTVTISGKAKGTATVTVKDGSGKTAIVSVTVKSAIIDATTPRFKWTNTIELDEANGWSTAILADRVAITSFAEKKQFVLVWNGGYTVGDKTDAKLRIVESGKTTEEIALTALEVQKVENNLYSIGFHKDGQKGELVFVK